MLESKQMNGEKPPVTLLLQAWKDGDGSALDQLIPLVYTELKRMAAVYLSREAASQTLQPTALVHEAYLRLAGTGDPDFHNSAHFRCVAARIMRQILVDRARARNTDKRHGGWRMELEDSTAAVGNAPRPWSLSTTHWRIWSVRTEKKPASWNSNILAA